MSAPFHRPAADARRAGLSLAGETPRVSAPVRRERKPARPVRKDPATGYVIPDDCYKWIPATETRAGHWSTIARRLAAWRLSVTPLEAPEAPADETTEALDEAPPVVEAPEAPPETETPPPVVEAPEASPPARSESWWYVEAGMVALLHVITGYGLTRWLCTVAPAPVGITVGVVVTAYLFALLVGAFESTPVRRWLAIAVFGLVSTYGSGATWYFESAGYDAAADMAVASWTDERAEALAPLRVESDRAARAEGEADAAHAAELADGGIGPRSKALAATAGAARSDAAAAAARLAAVESAFGAVAGLDAESVYTLARAGADAAGRPAPARSEYVEAVFAIPANRLRAGDPTARVGFGLAAGVDLIGIFVLGTALHRRRARREA